MRGECKIREAKLEVYKGEENAFRGKEICTQLIKNLIDYGREHNLCRIDLNATNQGYPIYKKLGFEDKSQKYTDMRIKFV